MLGIRDTTAVCLPGRLCYGGRDGDSPIARVLQLLESIRAAIRGSVMRTEIIQAQKEKRQWPDGIAPSAYARSAWPSHSPAGHRSLDPRRERSASQSHLRLKLQAGNQMQSRIRSNPIQKNTLAYSDQYSTLGRRSRPPAARRSAAASAASRSPQPIRETPCCTKNRAMMACRVGAALTAPQAAGGDRRSRGQLPEVLVRDSMGGLANGTSSQKQRPTGELMGSERFRGIITCERRDACVTACS